MGPFLPIIIGIVGRLIPVLVDYLQKGKDWRNIRLGDIEDTKYFQELEKELRKK